MGTIYQHDKRVGITYAYDSTSWWDKEKQQSRATRKLIGRVDEETGAIVPTRKKRKSQKPQNASTEPVEGEISSTEVTKPSPSPRAPASRQFCGATYLFDAISEKIGLTEDLKTCFPSTYDQILSIAQFLILESDSPLFRFPKWHALHRHPHGKNIPSQRSSELFASITEEDRLAFFSLQASRRIEKEYWAYDTTSISSYSECLKQIRPGLNREHDPLPQLNLALLFGHESNLPFYYRKLPGNISDVKTVTNMLADLNFLGLKKVHLVMDRGFYSAENINNLYKEHHKFVMGAKLSLKYVKESVDRVRVSIREWTNLVERHGVFATMVPIQWEYSQNRPNKKDTIKEKRRMYLHIYYSGERAVEQEFRFNERLLQLQKELQNGEKRPEHAKQYETYFKVHETPVRGVKVVAKQEAIDEAKKNYGFFALISNNIKDPGEALDIYRNKDVVEKAFANLKDRLSMRRLLVSSDLALDGKIFVQFIALIIISYLTKEMRDKNLFKRCAMQSMLDQLDLIECFVRPGKKVRLGEITEKQKELYRQLGISPPTSL